MAADFEDFARAASRRPTGRAPKAPALTRATVLGGGSDARLIAALCAAEGVEATLFSAYGAELDTLRGSGIALRGAGPIGSYHVDREGGSIRTTAELDVAVKGAEAIFLTSAWYGEHFPKLKARFEDRTISIPADAETVEDMLIVKLFKGIPLIPAERTKGAAGKRHGDFAVGVLLANTAANDMRSEIDAHGFGDLGIHGDIGSFVGGF